MPDNPKCDIPKLFAVRMGIELLGIGLTNTAVAGATAAARRIRLGALANWQRRTTQQERTKTFFNNGSDGNYGMIVWFEGIPSMTGGYYESLSLSFDLTTGQIVNVMIQISDGLNIADLITNTEAFLASTKSFSCLNLYIYAEIPAVIADLTQVCSGVTVNRAAGTVNFASQPLNGSSGYDSASRITINGTLTFTPF